MLVNKKKKIICTVTNDLVFDQRMQRIATSLSNNNYRVELVGRCFTHSKPVSTFPFLQTRLTCFFNKGFLFYAEFNIRLFFYLLFSEVDIICGCDLDTLPAAVLSSKIKGKQVVYDAHEYFPESPELIGRPFTQKFWYLLEKLLVNKVDALYTVTDSIAAIFHNKYQSDCQVVRNVPYKNNSPISKNKSFILLYQGAVNVGRGLAEMVSAMGELNDVEFMIAGDGDEMSTIKQKIKQLKLEHKVTLLGKKTPQELKEITQHAYIGINLLENRGLSYYYSLGNKTFDYIQAGIPQILIGFPEYISLNQRYHIGVVVDDLTRAKIVQAIQSLHKDATFYDELQQNCLKARETLCWEIEEKKLLIIYESLTKSNV